MSFFEKQSDSIISEDGIKGPREFIVEELEDSTDSSVAELIIFIL